MPICIECCYPVPQLYHVLQSRKTKSKAASTATSSTSAPSSPLPFNQTSFQSMTTRPITVALPEPSATPDRAAILSAARHASAPANQGGDVRLTQCPRCKRFADKYVEHDRVALFIDLVLVKPQVYRHLLFNRFPHDAASIDQSICRLGFLLLLFDVYLTMIYIENVPYTDPPTNQRTSPIAHLNVFLQWSFFVLVCALAFTAQHLTIRTMAQFLHCSSSASRNQSPPPSPHEPIDPGQQREGSPSKRSGNISSRPSSVYLSFGAGVGAAVGTPQSQPQQQQTAPSALTKHPTPAAISTALIISSCMSLFPILMVVWGGPAGSSETAADIAGTGKLALIETAQKRWGMDNNMASYLPALLVSPGRGVGWVRSGVAWAVALQNLEALKVLLDCGYAKAAGLVLAGNLARVLVRGVLLGMALLTE